MELTTLITKVENHIGYLYLNRPEVLNSFNETMHAELYHVLSEWKDNKDVYVILISSQGRAFCAGQDLQFGPNFQNELIDAGMVLEKFYNPLIKLISSINKPVVAAVNGTAAGAGMSFALACDVVVARKSVKFVQSFCHVGFIPDAGGTWYLPRLVGSSQALGLMMLGNKITADQALAKGMIWDVYEDDEFETKVQELLTELSEKPVYVLGLMKQAVKASFSNTLEEQLDLERVLQKDAGDSREFVEGVLAFIQKRKPKFNQNL